ncbi:MAG: FtsX-like permease family protein [Pseudomonadota bacterium]
MLLNYLLTTLHNLKHQPAFAAVKVLSMTIGLGCSILVIMHVQYALSFDKHFPNRENTYRVVTSRTLDYRMDTEFTNDAVPHQMLLDYPQIEHLAMIRTGEQPFTHGDVTISSRYHIATPEITDVFSLEFISGDPTTALTEPLSIVLSESVARKFFGDTEALGQTLTILESVRKITGVIRDLPKNSHIDIQILIPMPSITSDLEIFGKTYVSDKMRWDTYGTNRTYVTLPDKAAAEFISDDLPAFLGRNIPDDQKAYAERTMLTLSLEPLGDIYLSHRQGSGQTTNQRAQIITSLAIFASLILLTSCINFANLSFSQIRQRGKEIGLRKTLGAKRRDIVFQFLLESLLLTLFALCLALPLIYFAVPVYSSLTAADFTFGDTMNTGSIVTLVSFVLATGLLSGLLPALRLARQNMATVIKGSVQAPIIKRLARSSITVVQFGFSTALIMLAIAITLQIRHLNIIDVGFNKNDLVLLTNSPKAQNNDYYFNFDGLVNDLRSHPGIVAVSRASEFPPATGWLSAWRLPSSALDQSRAVREIQADENYLETMQLRLLAGRWFSTDFPADFYVVPPYFQEKVVPRIPPLYGVVITRTAAMSFGLGTPEQALGQQLVGQGDNYRVIGVVEDFRPSGGLEDPLSSTMMLTATQTPTLGSLLVRIDPAQTESALTHIDAAWQRYRPDLALNRTFYTQTYNDRVDTETRSINIAAIFASIISVLISAFGLYALAFYSTQRRTREVGVRKILGATSKKIIRLLTWDFLKPVLVACVMASIGGYFAIEYYLQQFSSRTEVSLFLYFAVTVGTLLVAALTVATQCYRAANADPARSLRYE